MVSIQSVLAYLCVAISAAHVIADYQEQINNLSQNVTIQLQMLRSAHSIMISSFLQDSLDTIGRHTAQGRIRTAESLQYIEAVNGTDSGFCVEQALAEQMLYAHALGRDLSDCAGRAYESVDALEEFEQLAGSVQLAAFLALNQGMVALEMEGTQEDRERYLREELEFLDVVWELYKDLLVNWLVKDAEQLNEALVDVDLCLTQAIFFYNFAIEFVKDKLDQCMLNK